MKIKLEASWEKKLSVEFQKEYFKKLMLFLDKEYESKTIYPEKSKIFNAFHESSFEKTKVVIIGQDPYHQKGQAHGLAFSVNNIKIPPSLKNIYKEINDDLGLSPTVSDGNLQIWAQQGVLLLNTILTVEDSSPMSHKNQGWEVFTDKVIEILNTKKENLVFILWGKPAESKASSVDKKKHLVLTAPHPSPLSSYRGFFGCKHFSLCNKYLIKTAQEPISW